MNVHKICKSSLISFLRLIENEKRTEEKAGEVVTFQILEHRSEIDRLNKVITKLENRVVELESQLKVKTA